MDRARPSLRLLSVIALLVATGCPPQQTIDQRIWSMVRCIECQDGEQDSVVAMGANAIPGLRHFLLEGPPDSTIQRQDSALSAPYYRSPGGRGTGTIAAPAQPPAAVVQLRLDDFAAMYRIRSSLALGLIGGNAARTALCEGKAMQFRPDVARMIDSALVLLNGTCP
jgi:hypothetical protein